MNPSDRLVEIPLNRIRRFLRLPRSPVAFVTRSHLHAPTFDHRRPHWKVSPLILILSILLGWASALESVPHASGLKPIQKSNVRRAPITKPSLGLSLVPHAHRLSTGVRRAPNTASAVPSAPVARPQKLVRPVPPQTVRPIPSVNPGGIPMMQMPMLPLFPQLSLLQPQQGAHPQGVPMMPVHGQPQQQAVPLMAIPTLSPHPVTLPPMTMPTLSTLIPMPTMPAMTMPPSFQRLLGMTSTSAPEPERRSYRREEKEFDDERVIKTKKSRGLSSVSSRLPKYVDEDEDIVAPEKNADWIVPF